MPVMTTDRNPNGAFALPGLAQLPASLIAALVPWWCALVLAFAAVAAARPLHAVAWAAAGLLYSCFITAAALYRLAGARA